MALLSTKTCGKHVGMNPQNLLGIDRYGEHTANHGLLVWWFDGNKPWFAVCSLPWYARYARYDDMMIWWESTSGNLWSYIEIWIMVGSQWNLPVICASHAKWWAMPFSKLSYGKWSVRAWFTMTYHDLPSRKWWFAMVALKYLRVHSSLYHTSLVL